MIQTKTTAQLRHEAGLSSLVLVDSQTPNTLSSLLESSHQNFQASNRLLKRKLLSFFAAKHEGFKSLIEDWGPDRILDASTVQKAVTESRRSFRVKPASWFKVEDAYAILSGDMDVSGEATTVLDPFAGWGARALGANFLCLNYIGIDANPLLVSELTDL
jgi:hypothetical protein